LQRDAVEAIDLGKPAGSRENERSVDGNCSLSKRQEIMAKHIESAGDFKDDAKIAALFVALDTAGVLLPRRRGTGPREGTWSNLSASLKKKMIGDLKRDYYRLLSKRDDNSR
jgi:hypothetical protein